MFLLTPAASAPCYLGFAQTIEFRIAEIVWPLPPPLLHERANIFPYSFLSEHQGTHNVTKAKTVLSGIAVAHFRESKAKTINNNLLLIIIIIIKE